MVSIYNQEILLENELFLLKIGVFFDFYGGFNIFLDVFEVSGKIVIYYVL